MSTKLFSYAVLLTWLTQACGDGKPNDGSAGDADAPASVAAGAAAGGSGGTGGAASLDGSASDGTPSTADAGTASDSDGAVAGGGDATASNTGGDASTASEPSEVRAFPGAEGFGAMVTGGRGGAILRVTTLEPTGPGSLQEALNTPGPRIIVFTVSGVIDGPLFEIPHGDLTIAGQTAPGGGITIGGRLYGAYDYDVGNMIIRHVRIRPEYDGSDVAQFDGIQFSRNHHLIFDHVSVSGGVDETVDLYESKDVSFQWSTVAFSHLENGHNYGLINGPDGARVSVHHSLFAHHLNRTPAIANGPAEMINLVDYNVRHGFVHHNPASGPFNLVGNYFKDGGDDTIFPFFFDDTDLEGLSYYLEDNFVEGADSDCGDGYITDAWAQCENLDALESQRAQALHDFTGQGDSYRPVTVDDVQDAYAAVLARAGAFPRDVVTTTAVSDVEAGSGSWGHFYPVDLMAGLTPAAPPTDADEDGMADDWELQQGLDPSDGSDHASVMPSGYTAIEDYVNGLADALVAP
ncbi:MAG: pectate lyase precursor [Myxococcales bacterium]|nr:pectate lyase precursor [Myxococcales bacterium]